MTELIQHYARYRAYYANRGYAHGYAADTDKDCNNWGLLKFLCVLSKGGQKSVQNFQKGKSIDISKVDCSALIPGVTNPRCVSAPGVEPASTIGNEISKKIPGSVGACFKGDWKTCFSFKGALPLLIIAAIVFVLFIKKKR